MIGEEDNAVGRELAESYIAQEGARFEVQVIQGDHVPMLSRTNEVVGIVRGFVGGGAM